MAPIEAVTFDVGLTLLFDPERELRKARRTALKRWLRYHKGLEKERVRSLLWSATRVWIESLEAGAHDAAARTAGHIVASSQIRVTDRERAQLQRLLEDVNREPRRLPVEGVRTALRDLKGRGVRIGIVSNRGANPSWLMMRELETTGLASFFERAAIAWSDEVGYSKPDPRIYLSSLRALGASPDRAAHVGDSNPTDILGARALGMKTIRYVGIRDDRRDGPEADVVIRHHYELAEALGFARNEGERPAAWPVRREKSRSPPISRV